MTSETGEAETGQVEPGAGQLVIAPVPVGQAPGERVRGLYNLSDPALSELGLDELLDELLMRVREALHVDTVAILLLDREVDQLVARAAKGIEEEVEQGVRIPIGKGFAGRIAAERVAIYIADVDHADILNPILRQKRIRSLLGVPLIVEGDLIGVLHVGSLRPRVFDQKDAAVLQVAAGRAAPGIERARLYSALEREHRVAMVLQRSLLPKQLVGAAGASVAARYLPARDEVGGDWYDVIELPRGLLGVAIGDVVGHGIKAAALMGQLRTSLHAYAIEGHSPGRTLELVDRFVQTMNEYAMATAAYAVFDPDTGTLRLASAGHLPPIIIARGGTRVLDVEPAPPLGASAYGSCTEYGFSLDTGETLVMYTDGLIERRGTALSKGFDELQRVLAPARGADEACRLAMTSLVPEAGTLDDVAIVALQNTPIPAGLKLQMQADPKELSRIRHLLRRWLRSLDATDEQIMEITLAVNEACANAIEHAYSPSPAAFGLEAHASEGEITIIVRDTGHWRSPRGQNRGRGLTIIDTAMDRVEINPAGAGTEIVMRRRTGRE